MPPQASDKVGQALKTYWTAFCGMPGVESLELSFLKLLRGRYVIEYVFRDITPK